jgi:hypothetical protein
LQPRTVMARMTGSTGRCTEAHSADGMRAPDRPPMSGPLTAPCRRKARRTGNATRVVVTLLVLFLIAGVGVFALGDAAAPLRTSPDDRSDRHNVATIKFAGDGNHCRQATIDNRTGELTDKGRGACEEPVPTDPKERLKQKYSGGRLQSIGDSFRSR